MTARPDDVSAVPMESPVGSTRTIRTSDPASDSATMLIACAFDGSVSCCTVSIPGDAVLLLADVAPGPLEGDAFDDELVRQNPSTYAVFVARISSVWLLGCKPENVLLAPNTGARSVPEVPRYEMLPCETPSRKSCAEPPFVLVA